MISIILVVFVAMVAVLMAITAIGAYAIERAYPPVGRFVETSGGRLHVLEMGPADDVPVVLLHGASGNLLDMRLTLGRLLAQRHRVILIDRPGHGWSERNSEVYATPSGQAAMIAEGLDRLGVERAIILGHSLAGAMAAAFALDFPQRTAALVLLAPATHPWDTGIAWFYSLAATPVLGQLFARTIVLPIAMATLDSLCRSVFAPQPMPAGYPREAAIALLFRPAVFIANGRDVAALLEAVKVQSLRYAEITAPTVIITGDRDTSVSPDIHARPLANTLPHAKLIALPGVGHAVQHVAADIVAAEIDRLAAELKN